MDKRNQILDACFSQYDFGEGVTVVDSDGWSHDSNQSSANDYIKVVYVTFNDDKPEDDSHKVSFHVVFNSKTEKVEDVYALIVESGNEIGFIDLNLVNNTTKTTKLVLS